MSNNKMSDSSKIIGIQFSILSPEEIRKGSVAQIVTKGHISITNQLLVVCLLPWCLGTRSCLSY